MSTRLYGDVLPDNDQTRARQEHFQEILNLVGNPYPNRFDRSRLTESEEGEDTITSVVAQFRNHEPTPEPGAKPAPEQLELANATLSEVGKVQISGRLATPPRVMGKAAFVHLSDGEERLQIYVRKQEARAISNDSLQPVEQEESGWKLFQLLDHGDFVGVEGKLFVTKTGELSVHVETIQFLSKALLPMPDKLHGINDPEIRQRQRYVDLIASSLKVKTDEEADAFPTELSTREVFVRRSKLVSAMRRHLDEHGYIEVETPMLSPIASGAAAKPFETFHKALGIPLYLRIAPELYLKRLLVGGFERVYELNRNFRNEGISARHNPEFTMLEFYTAYKDVNWMMDFCEEMLRTVIGLVVGDTKVGYGVFTQLFTRKTRPQVVFDFSQPFKRLTMRQAIAKGWKFWFDEYEDLRIEGEKFSLNWLDKPKHTYLTYEFAKNVEDYLDTAREILQQEGLLTEDESYSAKHEDIVVIQAWEQAKKEIYEQELEITEEATAFHIQSLFEILAEQEISQPTFIMDFPKAISPLSKASPDNPAIAERFELYVAGMEVANGFSELNDPAEQLERFEEQSRQREGGDEEAMQTDLDYVRALSYGMPPAAGIGIGIDRMTMLLTNRRSIRDVILFPHMRPRLTAEEQAKVEEEPSADS